MPVATPLKSHPQNDDLLHVAVDARCLNRPHLRGIGKVVTNVIELAGDDFRWTLLGDRPDLPFHTPRHPHVEAVAFDQRGYRFDAWQQWALPRRLARIKPDVFFAPANTAPVWQPAPTVTVVHDTIPWQGWHGEAGLKGWRRRMATRAVSQADAVISISQASAADLSTLMPRLASRLHVIPNAVDEAYFGSSEEQIQQAKQSVGATDPYVIYFGGSIPRKRLDWALRVFAAANIEGLALVLLGVQAASATTALSDISADIRARVIVPGFLDEQVMPGLIQGSVGVLYPTLYEGFGLPALEAQASGVACLMSPVASLAELAGPGAVMLPANDLPAWVAALKGVVSSNGLAPTAAAASQEWAKQFSWRRTAVAYGQIFADVAARRRKAMDVAPIVRNAAWSRNTIASALSQPDFRVHVVQKPIFPGGSS